MSDTSLRSIAMTREPDACIRVQLASGRYVSASEAVRTGLRPIAKRNEVCVSPARVQRKPARAV